MPIANPLILAPIRFDSTAYVLRVTLNSVAEDLDFPASGTLTTGRNYWFANDDTVDGDGGEGGVGDLCDMLQDSLDTHGQGGSWTVSLSSDRELTISHDTYDFTVHWGHANSTLDEAVWGAPAADSASSSQTLTIGKPVSGHWLPGAPWEDDSEDRLDITTGLAVSLSGVVYRSRLTERRKPRVLMWHLLPESAVRESAGDMTIPASTDSTQTDTYEYLWRGYLSYGYPIRVYEDESDNASYALYYAEQPAADYERDEQYRLRWRCGLQLRRVTA